jgi:hypothetical protein
VLFIATLASMQCFWSLDEPTRAAFIGAAAAFATAAITLLGVGIGLYVNRKSQQEERRLKLRREVYLNAANRYAASAQVLSLVADPSVDMRTIASPVIGEFAAAVAQIQLVGSERAMRAAVVLHREYVKIYTAMVVRRMPLEELKHMIDANNVRIAQIFNLQVQAEPAIRMALQELANLQNQNNALLRQLFEGQLRLTREIVEEFDKLAPLAMEATFAAKQEFGIQVEETPYVQFITESTRNMKESVLRSLEDVERRIAQISQPSTPTNPERES